MKNCTNLYRGFRRAVVNLVVASSLLWATACPPKPPTFDPVPPDRAIPMSVYVDPALEALRAGSFERAGTLAEQALTRDRYNSRAASVRALVTYQKAMHDLRADAVGVLETAGKSTGLDHARMRAALERTSRALTAVDNDLVTASSDSRFSLELCLACWERDWNHSGEVDRNDRLLFQIEIDARGQRLPEGDARRKPTFRFDVGDVHWARAMVAFQRAFIQLILAYRWTDLDRILFGGSSATAAEIRIVLDRSEGVTRARQLILYGLEHAERSRRAYLAETDDDHEWVPNPRQRNHPLPLPVDQELYDVWAGVLADVRGLIAGDTALSVSELAQLGDHTWQNPPRGYIDIAKMLAEPKDIVIDIAGLEKTWTQELPAGEGDRMLTRRGQIEDTLASVLGDYYDRDGQHKATPLVGRLARMKREMSRGEDTLERKLRYLLWLN